MAKSVRAERDIRGSMYKSLGELLDNRVSPDEDLPTAKLINKLKYVHETKCLTRLELEEICHWKSPRAITLIRQNSPDKINRLTWAAFNTRSERDKIKHLTSLQGVGLPMASAILMLTGPQRYGVIDIRVWKLLFALGSVRTNARGAGFSFKNWFHYLCILRYHAKRLGVQVRDVERTLFTYHKEIQVGPLY